MRFTVAEAAVAEVVAVVVAVAAAVAAVRVVAVAAAMVAEMAMAMIQYHNGFPLIRLSGITPNYSSNATPFSNARP